MRFPKPPSRSVRLVLFLALAGSAALVRPVAAAETAAANDPVIAEVVRLLDAHLGEPLIVRWLEDSGKVPAHVSADDLVALKDARASDQLIATLLDLAKGSAGKAPDAHAPVSAAPVPTPAPAPAAPALAAPPSSPTTAAGATAATVLVSTTLRYVHVADEGEAWTLVVYLDGVPFEPLAPSPSAKSAPDSTTERRVAPGHHVLRWAQERHRERRDEQGIHAARFDPEALSFDLAPGSPAEIAFEFRDRSGMFRRFGAPVTVRVAQDGRELAAFRPAKETYDWELLCEDYEANLGGRKPSFDDRRTLRNCLRWADLWKDVPTAPGRDAVRPPVH